MRGNGEGKGGEGKIHESVRFQVVMLGSRLKVWAFTFEMAKSLMFREASSLFSLAGRS